MPESSPCHDDKSDPHVETTIAAIDWNAAASIACRLLEVSDCRWGSLDYGGYNVVRFLHMDDENSTVLVVRVPYRPEEGWTANNLKIVASRLSSEVATMKYVSAHTSIPVPRVIHHSVDVDSGGVGSPYMIMTKVDGVPLSSIWDDLEDSKREIVLRQVVDILLELASQRFDKIGMLFQQENPTDPKKSWYITPYIGPETPDYTNHRLSRASTRILSSKHAFQYRYLKRNMCMECLRNRKCRH